MMSSEELNRCIDILSELNANANASEKRLILEMGYMIKRELDLVLEIERNGQRAAKHGNVEIKGLIQDNTQLFNENKKLLEENLKLKRMIESATPMIEKKIATVIEQIGNINTMLNKMS